MTRLAKRSLLAVAVCAAAAAPLLGFPSAMAAGGDFSLDFTAAAPLTYDHSTGGGMYDLRQVGRDKDIVESLEGADFACGDTVTFLTQIRVDAGAPLAPQTIRLRFEFTAHATGQQGIALIDNTAPLSTSAAMNYVGDTGVADDGSSTATASDESIGAPGQFNKPATFFRTVDVTDLGPGEKTVLRTDVEIACNGQSPTGNMQARLASASTITGVGGTVIEAIRVGDQTIPFKRVGDVKICDPKTQVCPPPPPK